MENDTIERPKTRVVERKSTIPRVARKPKPCDKPRFVAVIFANGKDDDTIGLQAAADDEPVQLDDKIYEPGQDIYIEGRDLVVTRTIFARPLSSSRLVYITRCQIHCRHGGAFLQPPEW
jgi:hypothetical protein